MSNERRTEMTISTRSHRQYFVVKPRTGDVLCFGNANQGLSYNAAAFDFSPSSVVWSDTRQDADSHRKAWIAELRKAKFKKELWSGWRVMRGNICVVLDEKKGR